MNEYINLDEKNIDEEHICCAVGDRKHQDGVDKKQEWIKSKLKDGHVFRKLNARGKIFIEYEPIETAWVPINGKNYMYIYCLWVAGSFKGKGIGKELLEYAIEDAKSKKMSGVCTLVSQKKKPFIGDKKFFEHYGFKVVDRVDDYELIALQFNDKDTPKQIGVLFKDKIAGGLYAVTTRSTDGVTKADELLEEYDVNIEFES